MISLTSAVQTCSVNVGYANKIQSDRFENYNSLLCPVWNGLDQYGRAVCVDSYVTKTAGCESAEDRVVVENYLRPQYTEFIPLDAMGYLNPSALGSPVSSKENFQKRNELLREQNGQKTAMQNASVGTQYTKTNSQSGYGNFMASPSGCPMNTNGRCDNGRVVEGYVDTRANRNFQDRRNLSGISNWKSNCYGCSSGNR